MIPADFAVRRIGLLATLAGPLPRTGAAMRDLSASARRGDRGRRRPDRLGRARGRLRRRRGVCGRDRRRSTPRAPPSFPASWTRTRTSPSPATATTRSGRRLAGASYQEIAAEGGGIVRTVEATRAASVEELAGLVGLAPRRDAAVRHDHGRGEERLRPGDGGRDPQPRGDPPRRLPPPGERGAHVPRRARGPPRAPGRPGALRPHPRRGDDPRGGRARPRRLRRRLLRAGRLHRRGEPEDPARRARSRPEAADPRRRARHDGRRGAGRRAPRALRRPPRLRLRRRDAGARRGVLRGDAAADARPSTCAWVASLPPGRSSRRARRWPSPRT